MKSSFLPALATLLCLPLSSFSIEIWSENFESIPLDTELGSYTTDHTEITPGGSGGTVRIVQDHYFGSNRALEIDRTPGAARALTLTPKGPHPEHLAPIAYLSLDFYQNRRAATDSGSGGATEQLRWAFRSDDGNNIGLINYRPDRGRLNTGSPTNHPQAYNTARKFHFFINNTDKAIVYVNPLTEQERNLAAGTLEFFAEGDNDFTAVSLNSAHINKNISAFQFYMNPNLDGQFFADNFKIREPVTIPEAKTLIALAGVFASVIVLRRLRRS